MDRGMSGRKIKCAKMRPTRPWEMVWFRLEPHLVRTLRQRLADCYTKDLAKRKKTEKR